MSNIQFILTIAVCAAATMLTRFLPFLVFGSRGGKVPEVVEYLGHVLPAAIFGMLIVYCLKSVTPFAGSRGIPEALAIAVTIALHKWKHQTLVSIAGGTVCYVLLVPLVCLVLFGAGSFLLPAMACILVLLVALRRPIESIEAKHGETEVPK